MTDAPSRIRRFLAELRRRKVYRVGIAYLVAAFVVLQLSDLAAGAFGFPGWFEPMVWVVAGLGFPIVLVIAWAFELTPEGVRRTPEAVKPAGGQGEPGDVDAEAPVGAAPPSPEERGSRSQLAVMALVGLGLVGAATVGGWYLVGGGEPSTENAVATDTARTVVEPRAGDRSIAVLPFEALGQAEPDVFTEGMHDDLLARLSNVSDLKVISRTAVQQYRDADKTTGEIARELGVRWVLEGGVQEMGEEIQVNAQLIDPRTETHAWADSYRRDLTAASLFDLQSEITRKIATSLEAELSPGEQERVERRPTEDLDAYRLYVRGRTQLNTRTTEGMRQAVDHFQQAIAEDSSYALAWSGLADAVALAPPYLDSLPPGAPGQETAARRALEFGSELAEAHASMGLVHIHRQNGPEALQELERAVELKPSYAQAHHWLGYLLMTLGRLDEADEHVRLAVELDPSHASARGVLVQLHLAEGRPRRALAEARRIDADVPWRAWVELEPLVHLNRWTAIDSLVPRLPASDPTYLADALAAAGSGDSTRARRLLQEDRTPEPAVVRVLAHLLLGERDAAFSVLSRAEGWNQNVVIGLRYYYPDLLTPIREDPRYDELIREANRAWGLNPDGSLPEGVDVSLDPPQSDA